MYIIGCFIVRENVDEIILTKNGTNDELKFFMNLELKFYSNFLTFN